MERPTAESMIKTACAAVGVYVGGVILILVGSRTDGPADVDDRLGYVTLAVICAAILLRRAAPVAGVVIGTVGMVADMLIGPSLGAAVAYTDNLYAATVHGHPRTPRILAVFGAVSSIGLSFWQYLTAGVPVAVVVLAICAIGFLSPIGTGLVVREHRTRADAEAARAETVARLADADRLAAVASERNRMAGELHDTIANHFSAIAMQSSVLLSRADLDADTVRAVVTQIRAGSLDGLADMRRTIEFLRADESTEDPVRRGVDDLPDLVTRMRAAGLTTRLTVTGTRRALPIAVDLAAYRIASEALVNALKHGADARVRVDYPADRLDLTIDNDLTGRAAAVPGSGIGLASMRERAHRLGGRFEASRNGHRWTVRAELPTLDQPEEP